MGMLVLSRRKDESLILRDEDDRVVAEIMVVNIRHSQVRIGIDSPPGIKVHRKEVDEVMQAMERKEEQ